LRFNKSRFWVSVWSLLSLSLLAAYLTVADARFFCCMTHRLPHTSDIRLLHCTHLFRLIITYWTITLLWNPIIYWLATSPLEIGLFFIGRYSWVYGGWLCYKFQNSSQRERPFEKIIYYYNKIKSTWLLQRAVVPGYYSRHGLSSLVDYSIWLLRKICGTRLPHEILYLMDIGYSILEDGYSMIFTQDYSTYMAMVPWISELSSHRASSVHVIDQVPFVLYYLDVTILLSYHPTDQAPFVFLHLDSTYFVRHLDRRGPRYYYCAGPLECRYSLSIVYYCPCLLEISILLLL